MKLDFGIKGLIINEEKILDVHKSNSQNSLLELPGG